MVTIKHMTFGKDIIMFSVLGVAIIKKKRNYVIQFSFSIILLECQPFQIKNENKNEIQSDLHFIL